MTQTRPTSDQVRFRSAATGDHILDTYLEAAEKGTRTLPDLLDDIFDAQGVLIPFGFRDYRGDWSTATAYVRGDVVRDPTNSNLYLVQSDHTAAGTIAADVTATNLVLLFDAETAAIAAGGVPASRTLTAGTGLTGGGDLSANRTLALDAATQASLNKADTALQPGEALVSADIGTTVQAYDPATAKTDETQVFTAPQRIAPTTDNDGSFDLAANHDFICTPTGAFTLTFTNRPTGQKGTIRLVNTGGHAATLGANIIAPDGTATAISTAGTYQVEYYSIDGTTVQIVASGALV